MDEERYQEIRAGVMRERAAEEELLEAIDRRHGVDALTECYERLAQSAAG